MLRSSSELCSPIGLFDPEDMHYYHLQCQ